MCAPTIATYTDAGGTNVVNDRMSISRKAELTTKQQRVTIGARDRLEHLILEYFFCAFTCALPLAVWELFMLGYRYICSEMVARKPTF